MKRRIFRSTLFVASLTAVISVLSLLFLFFPFLENELLQELKEEAGLIAAGMESVGVSYLNEFHDEDRRVTVIDNDGSVLFDSGTDISSMDNHFDREEIFQARSEGVDSSIRFSDTLTERTINYAMKLPDDLILRISVSQNYVIGLLMWLLPPVFVIIAAVIVISMIISGRVSNRILIPLYDIDLENPENSNVYDELRPLTGRIQEQNRKLKEKLYGELLIRQQRQNEFLSNMTHELKTPLTSISGFAELMMENDLDDATVRDFSSSIHDEAQRLISITGDIIKLAELDERKEEFIFEDASLIEMIREICGKFKISAGKKKITLLIEGNDTTVWAEKKVLYEVLYNLVDNAIKYNRDNGSVTVTVNNMEDVVTLKITDTGIGIPKSEQEHIFDRFYRADKSHSGTIPGTGLGLSIVREGLRLLGAGIHVDSNEGVGTAITLRFRRSEEDNL